MKIWRPSPIKIKNFEIGPDFAPFIVAEVGINHNGELEKALEMVRVAKQAGASAVKFQTFKAEEFVANKSQTFTYTSQGQQVTESMLDMFKRYEFEAEDWKKIARYCDQEEICFLSTPQNRSDLDLLLEIGIPAIKIGSDDFTNLPLIEDYASTQLPIIISCGMASLEEVKKSLHALGAFEGYPCVLLLCTSQYPTPPEDVNLTKYDTLKKEFPELLLGFSDHTQGPLASSLAVSFGACVFEKHFTLDHQLPGPDHWFSEDPQGLKVWIDSILQAKEMLGSPELRPTQKELEMRILARRSLVALTLIEENDVFDTTNLGLRRPGDGLGPELFKAVIGKKAKRRIRAGSQIEKGDFE